MFNLKKLLIVSVLLMGMTSICLAHEQTKTQQLSQAQEQMLPGLVKEVATTYKSINPQENEKLLYAIKSAMVNAIFKFCKTKDDKVFLLDFFSDANNQKLFIKLKTIFIQIAFDAIELLKKDEKALQLFNLTVEECQARNQKLLPLGTQAASNPTTVISSTKEKLVNEIIDCSNIKALLTLTEQISFIILKQTNNVKKDAFAELMLHQKLIEVTKKEFNASLSEEELNRLARLFKSPAFQDVYKNLATIAQLVTRHLNPALSVQIYAFLSTEK